MSRFPKDHLLDQAIAWTLRLENGDADTWGEFADWLEADPAHNDAYEAVVAEEVALSAILQRAKFPETSKIQGEKVAEHDSADDLDERIFSINGRPAARRWRWGSLAASLAVAGLVGLQYLPSDNSAYTIATAPGEIRTLALTDGSEIVLNGGTRIVLNRRNARTAHLLSGEARFAVRHDDRDPFTVTAGERRLVDVGTVFNVVQSEEQLRVGVAEGTVRFEGESHRIKLETGDSLIADTSGSIRVSRKNDDSIGTWADGVLVYDQTPLALVSEDLARGLGVTMVVPPSFVPRAFSGVIQTEGGKEAVRQRLEELLGARIVATGSRWVVQP